MKWPSLFQKKALPEISREEVAKQVVEKTKELMRQIAEGKDYWEEFDLHPFAHDTVLAYLRKLWAGATPDPEFEKTSLRSLNIKGINLSALFYLVAVERNIPLDRVEKFLEPDTPGADESTSIMFKKIRIMADTGIDEFEYLAALVAGGPLDSRQLQYNRTQVLDHADSVGFIVIFCRFLESLKDLEGHDAVDVKFLEIEEDSEWQR
ncbi:MAG: hypothetical protein WCH99_07460 [Verrucomicrobiota bacterium]